MDNVVTHVSTNAQNVSWFLIFLNLFLVVDVIYHDSVFFLMMIFSHYSMMRCVHAYPIIIFHLIVFFFSTADTVNSRLEDTLLWRTTLYGQQLNLTQKKWITDVRLK